MFRKPHNILFAVLCAIGCTAPEIVPETHLLRNAEQFCLDSRFAEAEPMLRAYLRNDPTNAVAHYYLGRCYLSGDLINLDMARGEITAALVLYYEVGQASPAARFTDEYFQLMCLADIGKTYVSEIVLEIPQMNLSRLEKIREANERVAHCEKLYERAKRVNPDAHLTKWLELVTAEAAASIAKP